MVIRLAGFLLLEHAEGKTAFLVDPVGPDLDRPTRSCVIRVVRRLRLRGVAALWGLPTRLLVLLNERLLLKSVSVIISFFDWDCHLRLLLWLVVLSRTITGEANRSGYVLAMLLVDV